MAFTFGFYNSFNGDRVYDAVQTSQIFDALIVDGVIQSQGNILATRPGSGMAVLVDTGMAWFNSTWSHNSAMYQVAIPPADISFSRWYAVVLEIDRRVDFRENKIILVQGALGANPSRPPLTNTEQVHQHALSYILVPPRVTQITASMIHIVVGRSETPFATGVLEGADIDVLFSRWENQWYHFFNNQSFEILQAFDNWKNQWSEFFNTHSSDILEAFEDWKTQWNLWFSSTAGAAASEMESWRNDRQNAFNAWFGGLQAILDGDIAANLANRILQHETARVSDGGVHGIRFVSTNGTLQVLTDIGWIVVGNIEASVGYTAAYFDAQGFAAHSFDYKLYTAKQFDTTIRTED